MAEPTDEELIADAMNAPKQTTVDGTVNVEHSLKDKLDAVERLAATRTYKKSRTFGIRFGKIRLPGAG